MRNRIVAFYLVLVIIASSIVAIISYANFSKTYLLKTTHNTIETRTEK